MSSGVELRGTVISSSSGTPTSRAFLSENSSAASTRPYRSAATSPSLWDSVTICCTSSAVKAAPTSSFGSIPIARTKAFETQSIARMIGLAMCMTRMSGGTSQVAAFSGPAMARFFGIISPMTTCR